MKFMCIIVLFLIMAVQGWAGNQLPSQLENKILTNDGFGNKVCYEFQKHYRLVDDLNNPPNQKPEVSSIAIVATLPIEVCASNNGENHPPYQWVWWPTGSSCYDSTAPGKTNWDRIVDFDLCSQYQGVHFWWGVRRNEKQGYDEAGGCIAFTLDDKVLGYANIAFCYAFIPSKYVWRSNASGGSFCAKVPANRATGTFVIDPVDEKFCDQAKKPTE